MSCKTIKKKVKFVKTTRKLYTYSPSKLEPAIAAVKNGMSIQASAKVHGVPRTTLADKIRTGTSAVSISSIMQGGAFFQGLTYNFTFKKIAFPPSLPSLRKWLYYEIAVKDLRYLVDKFF